jgi:hypothetical protein
MGVRGELFSTKVSLQNRTYFFNVKENRLGDLYLNIVESKNRDEGGFERQSVILFAEDIKEFLSGFDESLRVLENAVREKRRGSPNKSDAPRKAYGSRNRTPLSNGENFDRPRESRDNRERSDRGRGDRNNRERSDRGRGDRDNRERNDRSRGDRDNRERSDRGRGERDNRERSDRSRNDSGNRNIRERKSRDNRENTKYKSDTSPGKRKIIVKKQ